MSSTREPESPSSLSDLVLDQQAGSEGAHSSNWQLLKDLGNTAFNAGKHHEAIMHYTHALQMVSGKEQEALLYSNRSAARCGLSQSIRRRPAGLSERQALIGDDPTQLALLGLKDAEKAAELMPHWHKVYSRKGLALFLMERYQEAADAYQAGLALDPDNKVLKDGLKDVLVILKDNSSVAAAPTEGEDAAEDVAEQPEGSVAKRQRVMKTVSAEDCECTLCMKLLYEPVTTPCGHTFCKSCVMRAVDHNSRCPMCRTILHVGREVHVTVTFANLLMKCFPEEYEARRLEEQLATQGASDDSGATFVVPLFVMSVVLPGETMGLNIFEPRYRLMVRRCMEGSRRFGMAQVNASTGDVENVLVAAEIMECEPQPDGRFSLEMLGRDRVRVLSSWEQDGYRMAKVQSFSDVLPEDDEAKTVMAELSADVEKMLLAAVKKNSGINPRLQYRMMQEINSKPPSSNHEAISFWAAGLLLTVRLLPVSRVDVLRCTSTKERLEICKRALDVVSQHPAMSCRFM